MLLIQRNKMRILSVKFKNIGSYGNIVQTLNFERGESNLYQVLGTNGSGKSTIAKAITYLLYGRVEGSTLKDLMNRINNNLWGEIIVESKGTLIKIERGISPNILNIQLNGVDYDVAKKSNVQDFLENELYEIPYHVFKNVIILSINDFKSFITMSPYDKKQIIDKMFGLSIINSMRELVKQKRKLIVDEIKQNESEIKLIEESISSILNKIEAYENDLLKNDENKLILFKERLVKQQTNRQMLSDANLKIIDAINKNTDKFNMASRKENEYATNILHLKKQLELYSNNKCHTCHSPLTTKFHIDIKNEKEKKLASLQAKELDVKNIIIKLQENLITLRNKGRQIHIKIKEIETDINNIKGELIQLTKSNDIDAKRFNDIVLEFQQKRDSKLETKQVHEDEDAYLQLLETLLSDDGIKNIAVRSFLPAFNLHVQNMATEMGVPFIIKFDGQFNCSLYYLGHEIAHKTLSTGERKRVDFVIIMALIRMIKLQYSGLNLLFLDEIFSSIDADGVYHIIKILHNTIHDIGLNVFVINHTVLPTEYFDKKLETTKAGGFSEFTIENVS